VVAIRLISSRICDNPRHQFGGTGRRMPTPHSFAISPRVCASFAYSVRLLNIRGRRECRALDRAAACVQSRSTQQSPRHAGNTRIPYAMV